MQFHHFSFLLWDEYRTQIHTSSSHHTQNEYRSPKQSSIPYFQPLRSNRRMNTSKKNEHKQPSTHKLMKKTPFRCMQSDQKLSSLSRHDTKNSAGLCNKNSYMKKDEGSFSLPSIPDPDPKSSNSKNANDDLSSTFRSKIIKRRSRQQPMKRRQKAYSFWRTGYIGCCINWWFEINWLGAAMPEFCIDIDRARLFIPPYCCDIEVGR